MYSMQVPPGATGYAHHHGLERDARLGLLVRLAVHQDRYGLLTVKVIILPQTNHGRVPRYSMVLVVASGFPKELTVMRDVPKMIEIFAGCWIGRLINFSINMDAHRMLNTDRVRDVVGYPTTLSDRMTDHRFLTAKFLIFHLLLLMTAFRSWPRMTTRVSLLFSKR